VANCLSCVFCSGLGLRSISLLVVAAPTRNRHSLSVRTAEKYRGKKAQWVVAHKQLAPAGWKLALPPAPELAAPVEAGGSLAEAVGNKVLPAESAARPV
jgi:hypothetical protein